MILNNFPGIETIRLHFIKYPVKEVENELGNIISDSLNKRWKKGEVKLDIGKTYSYHDGKNDDNEIVKCIIWQPQSIEFDLVVFLTNMSDGWPTLLNKYFSLYGRETICAVLSDDHMKFPFYYFEYKLTDVKRIVLSMRDADKWEFVEQGPILTFENELYYKERKKSDRLNSNIIHEYLIKNGIDISKDDFWVSKGMAIEFETKLGKP